MGNEETPRAAGSVSYLSLLYDLCLVRDRLRWIIADLEDTIYLPDQTIDALERVNAFLGAKLEERGLFDGKVSEASDIPGQFTPPEAPMGA